MIQPFTFMQGTYQRVYDLWSIPLPFCTVHTKHYRTSDTDRYNFSRYLPDSTWPLIQAITLTHGTHHTVRDIWYSPLPLCTVHTRHYLTSDPTRYPLHGTYKTVLDIRSSPLPLCSVHNREYGTFDPSPYRYVRYVPDSTWPLIQPVTILHGTYQRVLDLLSSPLSLRTVHTRQYGTSDTAP